MGGAGMSPGESDFGVASFTLVGAGRIPPLFALHAWRAKKVTNTIPRICFPRVNTEPPTFFKKIERTIAITVV